MRFRWAGLLCLSVVLLPSPVLAAAPEAVAIETSDGFALRADLWRAPDPGAPVAILLHQFNRDRHSYSALVPALERKGFTVLALDQRGQGESKTQKTANGVRRLDVQELPRGAVGAVVKAGPADVAAALELLAVRGVETDRVVLVGASYGCTVSLLAAAATKSVRAVALLSPGTDYFGVDVLPAARSFAGALFAIAAEDDPVKSSPVSARTLAKVHEGPEELVIHPTGGHGTALLESHPDLADAIAAFLADVVATPGSKP